MVVKPALLTRMSTVSPSSPDLLSEREARLRVGEVGRHHLGAHVALVGQFVGQGPEPILAAGHEGDAVAPLGQVTRDLGADARGRPGHQGGGVLG